MTEGDLLSEVLRLAEKYGVLAYHVYDSRRSSGPGFPDLVLASTSGLMFVELKDSVGMRSPDQVTWAYTLAAAGQAYAVWRPRDLESGLIESELSELATDYMV